MRKVYFKLRSVPSSVRPELYCAFEKEFFGRCGNQLFSADFNFKKVFYFEFFINL